MATAEVPAGRRRPDPRRADHVAELALALLALAAAVWIMREGRGLIFFFDEWDWVLSRRDGLEGLFAPHNGHFSLVPVAVFKLLFATAGVDDYWAYRLVGVLGHLLCAGLLFALARRRAGPGVALAAATVLLLLGAAWQVILWPFEISYLLSVASGLGALLALDARSRAGNLVAGTLVLVALASSGLGLAVAAGVLAELLADPSRRRRTLVALAPLALYAVWYAAASPQSDAKRGNIDAVPGYVADAAAGAAGAVAGLGLEWGRVLLAALTIVVIARLLEPGPVRARLIGLLVTGLAFWGLLAVARADLDEPLASRYVYFGAVIVLLIAVEVIRGGALPPRAQILVGLAVCASVLANLGDLREGATGLRSQSDSLRAALAATELAGDAVPATTKPEPDAAPQLPAGPYRELVADAGSPIGGPQTVLRREADEAVAVDVALARVLGVSLSPGGDVVASRPPPVLSAVGGRARRDGSCVRFTPGVPGAAIDLRLAAGSAIVLRDAGAPAQVRLRRMAAEFSAEPLGDVAVGAAVALVTPPDRIARPWVLRVSGGPLRACAGEAA